MLQNLPGFLIAAVALTASPGPNTLSLAAAGAAFGVRGGAVYMVGLTSGMLVVMALVASGVTAMVLAVPGARALIGLGAAVYFVWLAWRIATAPPIGEASRQRRRPGFAAGVLQSLVNPKAYAAMAALFSGFVLVAGRIAVDNGVKLGVLMGVLAVVNVAWLAGGAALTRCFGDPRLSRIINITFALLLLASVALALTL